MELQYNLCVQVPPAEIETVLMQHPGVRDVGVVGLPDDDAGELPLAFVVRQIGANPTEKELKDFVAERVCVISFRSSICNRRYYYFN